MGLFDHERGTPPVWFMRQAGRYLPEYRALRQTVPHFLDFCLSPTLAAEATLQPLQRFDLDGAVVFSDILIVPYALTQQVTFTPGEGPKLSPLSHPDAFDALDWSLNCLRERWAPTCETLTLVSRALRKTTSLIGFVGAPWTLLCYMIDGGGSKTFPRTKQFARRYPDAFRTIIHRLTDVLIAYLEDQIKAGATVLQVFDSWASLIPFSLRQMCLIDPHRRLADHFKTHHKDVPVIFFPRGIGAMDLASYGDAVRPQAISIDESVDPVWVARTLPQEIVIQGGLCPHSLVVGGDALDTEAALYLDAFKHRRYILNLGHGIVPETPIDHVARLVDFVRTYGRDQVGARV